MIQMPRCMNVLEMDLDGALDRKLAVLLEAAFGTDDGYDGCSFYIQQPHQRVSLWRGRVLLGQAAPGFRVIRAGAASIDSALLGDFAVLPEQQGKGYGNILLRVAIALAEASLAKYLLLWGDHPIYAHNGFRTVSNQVSALNIRDERSTGLDRRHSVSLMVRELTGKLWNDDVEVDLLGPVF